MSLVYLHNPHSITHQHRQQCLGTISKRAYHGFQLKFGNEELQRTYSDREGPAARLAKHDAEDASDEYTFNDDGMNNSFPMNVLYPMYTILYTLLSRSLDTNV